MRLSTKNVFPLVNATEQWNNLRMNFSLEELTNDLLPFLWIRKRSTED